MRLGGPSRRQPAAARPATISVLAFCRRTRAGLSSTPPDHSSSPSSRSSAATASAGRGRCRSRTGRPARPPRKGRCRASAIPCGRSARRCCRRDRGSSAPGRPSSKSNTASPCGPGGTRRGRRSRRAPRRSGPRDEQGEVVVGQPAGGAELERRLPHHGVRLPCSPSGRREAEAVAVERCELGEEIRRAPPGRHG